MLIYEHSFANICLVLEGIVQNKQPLQYSSRQVAQKWRMVWFFRNI